jgi:hypothetical protein
VKTHLWNVVLSIVAACAPLGLFTGLLMFNPRLPPGPFWMVPAGLLAGFTVFWRRYPGNVYPIGLLYFPVLGAILLYLASLVSWHIVGDYI